ncbi:hypothetical protein [Nonomuraea endophytica]|uniref:Uncharacterized protein n=1 Tax=Nonomuraea endophytica TaxID=714136 RepID=A0A7W8ABB9_9ACTN|nr:hypothetical protein [Nonomuraea endophytica]MBB5082489.1 hypothetical protein [Nonomuraea endophytica]
MLSLYVDLAIGLILSFLLLSLLVSGINEGIVRLLAIRSKFLWAYLRDTMDGSSNGRAWLPAKIRDVFTALPFLHDPRPKHSDQPSPVESTMPAHESVADDAMTKLLYERVREIDHPKTGKTSISNIPPARFAVALMELAATDPNGVEGWLAKLKAMKSPLYGHLMGVWEGAQRDLDRFRQGVETWFDGEMQRLSMLYKRYVKWVMAALGLVVTLLFSMDGLEYSKTLLRDNGLRTGVAAVAAGDPATVNELKAKCTENVQLTDCLTETLSSPALVKIFDNAIMHITIPADGDPSINWNGGVWWDRLTTLSHWPGYLLTYVALLFGAPFWWDLFRRITGLKSRR